MRWNPEEVLPAYTAPVGYSLHHARPEDVPELTARLRDWYPDIVVGAESGHLEPEFYQHDVYLAGGDPNATLITLIARDQAHHAIVAALSLSRDARARTISGRLGAVDPEHRATTLGFLGVGLLQAFGRAMGAELAYYFATLKSRHQQVIAERFGFDAVGIVPAFDRDMIEPGQVRRVYEVLYAKVLVDPSEVVPPAPEAMTARTRALYNHIFQR